MREPTTCGDCRIEDWQGPIILCRKHAAVDELVRALEQIAEASYESPDHDAATEIDIIRRIARNALSGQEEEK